MFWNYVSCGLISVKSNNLALPGKNYRVLGIPSGILEPRIVPVEVLNHEDHPLSINVPDEKPKYRHFVDETYVAVDEEFPDFRIRAIHKNQAGHPDSIGQKIDRKDVKADKYVEKIYVKIDQKPKAISKTVAQPKEAEGLQAKKDNGIHNEQPKKGNAAESEVYGDANGQADRSEGNSPKSEGAKPEGKYE